MKILSSFTILFFFILVALALSSIGVVHTAPASSSSSTTKKSTKTTAPSEAKYVELYDLFSDLAKRMCSRLGPLIQETQRRRNNRKFNWRTRCDLFYETLENTALRMADTMVNELDLTQKQLLDAAMTPQNYFSIVQSLKTGIKDTLTNPDPRINEKELSNLIHRLFSKSILDAATMDHTMYQEMRKLPRDAARNAQMAGIRMPSYGLQDMDELDEEAFLTGEDLQWAQSIKSEVLEEVHEDSAADGDDGRRRQKTGDQATAPESASSTASSGNEKNLKGDDNNEDIEGIEDEEVKKDLIRSRKGKKIEKIIAAEKKNTRKKLGIVEEDDDDDDDFDEVQQEKSKKSKKSKTKKDDEYEAEMDRAADEADEKLIDDLSNEDWLNN